MKNVNRLNDLTREQIAEIRNNIAQQKTNVKVARNCEFCNIVTMMRPDQKYCCARCRKFAFEERKDLAIALLQKKVEDLTAENKALKEKLNGK